MSAVKEKEEELKEIYQENKLYELSRMVKPTMDFTDNIGLFLNKEETLCYINGAIRDCNIYKFAGWMNMFAAKKHYYYCELGDIYLKLDIEGDYILKVTGSSRDLVHGVIDTDILNIECHNGIEIKIPDSHKYEGIYYTITEDKDNPINIRGGSWCTNCGPKRDNKIAIVTCTYKREDYINKNIAIFEEFINKNPGLNDKIKMIVVDNGKTLDISRSNETVKIIPNINAGGSGGFTRGLIYVIDENKYNNGGFTRVLFMDDDVEIFPESFFRTLILANYLKEEFKDSFISGAMLDLYKKNMFWKNLGVQNGLIRNSLHNAADLNSYKNILKVNNIPPGVFKNKGCGIYTCWWYQSFSINESVEQDLPLPLFFRDDDVEYGFRHPGRHHISMNGICVWHAPFAWRISLCVENYYMPRNEFFVNIIHNSNFKKQYKSKLKNRMKYLINTYNYTALEIYKKALQDILKGSRVFKSNPEELLKEVNAINSKHKYIDCYDEKEMEYAGSHRVHVKKWRKFVWKITHWGRYCPEILFKKRGAAVEWYPPKEDFMLVKEVKVYNLLTRKYEVRKFDRRKLNYYEKEITGLINRIDKNYDKLHRDYIEGYKEFITMEFWRDYLGIQGLKTCRKLV